MLFKPGNALKYTIKGSITLRYQDYSNNRVEISVSDTGLGIKKEDQKKLFKAFGKVEDKKDILLNATGVGLGLLISNVISTQLNSDYDGIKVESKYGIGSRFSFFVDDVISEELSIISDPLHHLGDIAGLEMEYKLIHYINNRKTNKIKRLTINDRNKTSSSGYITNPFSNHVPNSFTKLHSCLNNTDGFFEEVPSIQERSFSSPKGVMTSSCKGGAINRSITEQELNIIATERQIERIRHHARSKHCNCPLFLVVDDNDFNILAFDMQFKRLEITADSALSGDEAVHKVLEFSKNKCCRFYNIILLL